MIYFTDPSHPISWDSEFRALIEEVRETVAEQAQRAGMMTHSIGASSRVEDGSEVLEAHAPWDEISLGGLPTNAVLVEHVWNEPPARSVWPQVIIASREFEVEPGKVTILETKYLARLRGPREIKEWVEGGGRLDLA